MDKMIGTWTGDYGQTFTYFKDGTFIGEVPAPISGTYAFRNGQYFLSCDGVVMSVFRIQAISSDGSQMRIQFPDGEVRTSRKVANHCYRNAAMLQRMKQQTMQMEQQTTEALHWMSQSANQMEQQTTSAMNHMGQHSAGMDDYTNQMVQQMISMPTNNAEPTMHMGGYPTSSNGNGGNKPNKYQKAGQFFGAAASAFFS